MKRIAFHESGHAVAHVRLGVQQSTITIVRSEDALGSVLAEGEAHVWDAMAARGMAVCYCAGYAALLAAGYSEAEANAGADSDFAHAVSLIETWRIPGTLADLKAAAVELMRRPENTRAVCTVAEQLLKRRTLDGELVEVLVEVADGETTQVEFEQYLAFRSQAEAC